MSTAEYDYRAHPVRWLLPPLVGLTMFANHWARDAPGTVQMRLEEDFPMSSLQYGLLSAVYYAPNIAMPVVAGALAQRSRSKSAPLLGFVALAVIGHAVFAWGAATKQYSLLLSGRCVLGLCYEAIDMGGIPFMGKIFKREWAFVVGVTNSLLRSGSVAAFFATPLILAESGATAVLLLAALVGATGLIYAGAAHAVVEALERRRSKETGYAALATGPDGAPPEKVPQSLAALTRALPRSFWLYLAAGALVYSAIVPWLVLGGKIIQIQYGAPISLADRLMLLPEAAIVFICPPLGISVDKAGLPVRRKLYWAMAGGLAFPASLAAIAAGDQLPCWAPALTLSVGWSVFNTMYWAALTDVVPEEALGLGAGLLGGSLNLGPSFLPTLLAVSSPETALFVMAACALVGIVFIGACAEATVVIVPSDVPGPS